MDIWLISALSDDNPSTYIVYVGLSLYPHIYMCAYHIYSNPHCRGRSIASEEEPLRNTGMMLRDAERTVKLTAKLQLHPVWGSA